MATHPAHPTRLLALLATAHRTQMRQVKVLGLELAQALARRMRLQVLRVDVRRCSCGSD